MKEKMIKWKSFYDTLHYEKKNVNKLVELFQLLFVQASIETFGFKQVLWEFRKENPAGFREFHAF